MKRAFIWVTLIVAVFIIAGRTGHSLADRPQERYSGPDFGKDPPPKKLTAFLRILFA